MSDPPPNFKPKPVRMLFQIVTDKAPPLFDGTKEPPAGVAIHTDDITISATGGIQVKGKKGINVQKGKTKERILSPDEQTELLNAAKAEAAFQKCRTDAKQKTSDREDQFKKYTDAANDQAAKQKAFDKAKRDFEQALAEFRSTRAEFEHLMKDFSSANDLYAKALTSVLHQDSGGVLSKLHITNTPLEDVCKYAQLVNVSGNEGIDEPEQTDPGSQSEYKAKAQVEGAAPNPKTPDLASNPLFYKYNSYKFLEPDPEAPAPGSGWDSLKQQDPGKGACDAALGSGDGSTTVALKTKRKDLGTAAQKVDDTYKAYASATQAKKDADKTAGDEKQKLDDAKQKETDAYNELNKANSAAVEAHDKAQKKVSYQEETPDPMAQ